MQTLSRINETSDFDRLDQKRLNMNERENFVLKRKMKNVLNSRYKCAIF